MMTGEVIFGGVGAGLYGILLYCILAVFIAGLMVGRTPEYIGKKIEQKEVKMAMLAVIATAFSILVFTALSSVITFPAKGYWNPAGTCDRQLEQQLVLTVSARFCTHMSAAPATTAARSEASLSTRPGTT